MALHSPFEQGVEWAKKVNDRLSMLPGRQNFSACTPLCRPCVTRIEQAFPFGPRLAGNLLNKNA
jgi:hypothetical protein